MTLITSCNDENDIEKNTEKPDNEINMSDSNQIKLRQNNDKEEALIASFETKIIDKSDNRIHNLKLASSMIDGYILNPGEVFSFNETVGEADEEKGFKKAIVLHKKEKILDDGGGVCQVSSTLFNAAEQAGLEIIERHSHSKFVGYIPQGKDAAIAYGVFDLQFKNIYAYSIKIKVVANEETMSVSIIKGEMPSL